MDTKKVVEVIEEIEQLAVNLENLNKEREHLIKEIEKRGGSFNTDTGTLQVRMSAIEEYIANKKD